MYEPQAIHYHPVPAQTSSEATDIADPNATRNTPLDYSSADTETTYKAHPGGYEPVRRKIAAAKHEMLERVIKSAPPKLLARKMVQGVPDELLVIEEFNEEHENHKERAEGKIADLRAAYFLFGLLFGTFVPRMFNYLERGTSGMCGDERVVSDYEMYESLGVRTQFW